MRPQASPSPPSLLPPGVWSIDASRSTVAFKVRHFGFATVEGSFARCSGRVSPGGVFGAVRVNSIDTGLPVRDERLRSSKFFDAARFPEMTVSAAWPVSVDTSGSCTIRDRSQPVDFAVSSEALGDGAVALRATTRISRRAFGLDWPGLEEAGRLLVSDRVDIRLDLVLTKSA